MFYLVGDQRLCDACHPLGICCLRRRWRAGRLRRASTARRQTAQNRIQVRNGLHGDRKRSRRSQLRLLGRLQSNRASELSNGRRTGLCYAWRMSPVATLAMLMLMLMPAAAASIPAVKSAQCPPGHIVSGGYCTPMFRRAPGLPGLPFPGEAASLAIGHSSALVHHAPHRAWPRPAQWAKWRISATAERHACSFMLPSVPRGTQSALEHAATCIARAPRQLDDVFTRRRTSRN